MSFSSSTTTTTTTTLLLLLLFVVGAFAAGQCTLESQITASNFQQRLHDLEDIARANAGNRAAGTSGYQKSVEYVTGVLEKFTNYTVTVQSFPFQEWYLKTTPSLKQLLPFELSFVYGTDFSVMRGSTFDGTVKSRVVVVPDGGCKASDFPKEVSGNIAIIERNDCGFKQKVALAVEAGAVGVVIVNVSGGPLSSRVGYPTIPVMSLAADAGKAIILEASTGDVVLTMELSSVSITRETYNIIADLPGGDPNNVMIIGSHLDSVPAGPGINDNGSGTTTNLEIALAFSKCLADPKLGVRFAWWGAEELGLLGSTHYVEYLKENNPSELKRIALNVNLDMIASPNFVYFIYDGVTAPEPIRDGSARIQTLYQKAMESLGEKHEPTAFDGRSDYGPFIENGIPAGGIAAGAEVLKDIRLRNVFGGIANTAFDPCYHNECDDYPNVNQVALMQFAKATASVVETLATTSAAHFISDDRVIYDEPLLGYPKDEKLSMHTW